VTAHWIEVDDGKWKLRSEVVGFKGLSGNHSGDNLGRYLIGLYERVGIITESSSKVSFCSFILSNLRSWTMTSLSFSFLAVHYDS
jgi:hypothetical protein